MDVILVDERDSQVGIMEKMEAHRLGLLHRAFSVFVFNTRGELLLQQRAFDKYHSGGKWTNTCCSHPGPGEVIAAAANRRLAEEMGMQCQLHYAFNFIYNAPLQQGISEHEFDHVFIAISDQQPLPDPGEVAAFKYVQPGMLINDIAVDPEAYSEWLKICLGRVLEHFEQMFKA